MSASETWFSWYSQLGKLPTSGTLAAASGRDQTDSTIKTFVVRWTLLLKIRKKLNQEFLPLNYVSKFSSRGRRDS
eukprot:1519647-Rhodomonas_salina.1